MLSAINWEVWFTLACKQMLASRSHRVDNKHVGEVLVKSSKCVKNVSDLIWIERYFEHRFVSLHQEGLHVEQIYKAGFSSYYDILSKKLSIGKLIWKSRSARSKIHSGAVYLLWWGVVCRPRTENHLVSYHVRILKPSCNKDGCWIIYWISPVLSRRR